MLNREFIFFISLVENRINWCGNVVNNEYNRLPGCKIVWLYLLPIRSLHEILNLFGYLLLVHTCSFLYEPPDLRLAAAEYLNNNVP
jgi:hypothetical protein